MSTPQDIFNEGLKLFNAGDKVGSIEKFKQALAMKPDYTNAAYNIGIIMAQLWKKTESIEYFDKTIAIDPNHIEAHRNKGINLLETGKYEESIKCFDRTIELKPDHHLAFNNKGNALKNMGRIDEAIVCYDKAISIKPDYSSAYLNKGGALYAKNQYTESIEYYKKALEYSPNDAGAYHNIANAYYCMNKKTEALVWYTKSLESDPASALVLCNRGRCYGDLGRQGEALEDYKKANELMKTNPGKDISFTAYNSIKDILSKVTELNSVADKAQELVNKSDKTDVTVQKFVANIKKLQEQKDKAIQEATKNITNSSQTSAHVSEMDRIKLAFQKELDEMKAKINKVETEVKDVKKDVAKLQNDFQDIKEELSFKLNDYKKKLEAEIGKLDLSEDKKTMLMDYYHAFLETFSSVYVTSQVVDSGLVKLDSGTVGGSLLSTMASFSPFFGNFLSEAVKSIDDLITSKQMKDNARKMKGMASDPTELSQVVGKTAYDVILNTKKQQKILNVTEEDLIKKDAGLAQKILSFCDRMQEKIDGFLYIKLYKTTSSRLGHHDANELVKQWLGGKMYPYDISTQFVKILLAENSDTPSNVSEETLAVKSDKTSCCNMF